jgi:YVTN family beta-propeller protein
MVATFALALLAGCEREVPDAATSRAYLVYATNEISGDLSIIDPLAGRELARVALGKRPRGLAASPDGRLLYIALSGSPIAGPGVDESTLPPADKTADGIAVFDLRSRRVLRVLRGISDPEQVAVSPDGRRLYVASEDTGRMIVLDSSQGAVLASFEIGGEPEGVAVSPNGRVAYGTSEVDHVVAVVDTAGNRLRRLIRVGERPRNIAFTSDSRRAFVPGENDASITAIDVATDAVVGRATIPGETIRPMGVALSPDDHMLYVTTGRGRRLARLDAERLTVTAMVEVGERPWGVAVSPDGSRIFTANGPSHDVAIVDAANFRVAGRVAVGQRPWGVIAVRCADPC